MNRKQLSWKYIYDVIINIFYFLVNVNDCLKQLYQSRRKNGTILICGSSHAQSSFVVEMGCDIHTLTFPSQDVECALSILKFYKKHYNINKCVIFVSVFTPGFRLRNSRVFGRGHALRLSLFLGSRPFVFIPILFAMGPVVRIARLIKQYFSNSSIILERRVMQHVHYNKKTDSIELLNNLIDYCSDKSIRLFFVKSPASSAYIDLCESKTQPYVFLDNIIKYKNNISVIDLWSNADHIPTDWHDYDHLKIGSLSAIQSTKLILQMIT